VHVPVRISVHIIGDTRAGICWARDQTCASLLFSVSLSLSDGAETEACGWLSLIHQNKRLLVGYVQHCKSSRQARNWQDCRGRSLSPWPLHSSQLCKRQPGEHKQRSGTAILVHRRQRLVAPDLSMAIFSSIPGSGLQLCAHLHHSCVENVSQDLERTCPLQRGRHFVLHL